VANMVEGGATPLLDRAALGAMGYAIALYANAALRCAQRAVADAYAELRATGSSAGLTGVMATWDERQAAVGKPAFDALEARYATP
jgi:2-methylisocitrate lyase-like PEP mutase family enzyme